jgi:hypothetical protein
MFDGQSVELSLPWGSVLAANLLGSGNTVDISNGSWGVVRSVLDVSNSDTLAAVKFFNFKHELVIPIKYLKALS